MSGRPTVLFGGSGRLGRRLLERRPEWLHPERTEVDLRDGEAVMAYLAAERPRLVIHAAAIVGRRETEADRPLAWAVNVQGSIHVARACFSVGARLVYLGSAAVYAATPPPHVESAVPRPTYFYAWSKLLGEQAVTVVADHAIVRTDFFEPAAPKYRQAFVDHRCSKLPVARVAAAVERIAESDFRGVINVGGPTGTLYDVMRPYVTDLEGIRIADSAMPDFPTDLSLDTTLFRSLFADSLA